LQLSEAGEWTVSIFGDDDSDIVRGVGGENDEDRE
jgi:hypothetical protein